MIYQLITAITFSTLCLSYASFFSFQNSFCSGYIIRTMLKLKKWLCTW